MSKKKHEEHVNHERWAIPYADLITLLLALFVVLYAGSVANRAKFAVMSSSMIQAFNGSAHSVAPSVKADDGDTSSVIANHGTSATTLSAAVKILKAQQEEQRRLDYIQAKVEQAMHPLIEKQLVSVHRAPERLEIEIRTDILFASGEAALSKQADDVLDQIAVILQPFANPVRIEGYTDDVPINTSVYPSNWELSASRAASVARLFSDQGVDSTRLGIEGWADNNPAGDNSTEDGRNKNRRVLVVVLGNPGGATHYTVDPSVAPGIMKVDADGASPNAAMLASASSASSYPSGVMPMPADAGADAPKTQILQPLIVYGDAASASHETPPSSPANESATSAAATVMPAAGTIIGRVPSAGKVAQ